MVFGGYTGNSGQDAFLERVATIPPLTATVAAAASMIQAAASIVATGPKTVAAVAGMAGANAPMTAAGSATIPAGGKMTAATARMIAAGRAMIGATRGTVAAPPGMIAGGGGTDQGKRKQERREAPACDFGLAPTRTWETRHSRRTAPPVKRRFSQRRADHKSAAPRRTGGSELNHVG